MKTDLLVYCSCDTVFCFDEMYERDKPHHIDIIDIRTQKPTPHTLTATTSVSSFRR